jgi:hypothetical protein
MIPTIKFIRERILANKWRVPKGGAEFQYEVNGQDWECRFETEPGNMYRDSLTSGSFLIATAWVNGSFNSTQLAREIHAILKRLESQNAAL